MSKRTRWKIEVTQADIDRAIKSDSAHCVVAQALARTIKDASHFEVDTQAIRFTRGDERLLYLTPPMAQQYVIGFDAGDKIEPFEFTIMKPRVVRRVNRSPEALKRKHDYDAEYRARKKAERGEPPAKPRPRKPKAPTNAQEAIAGLVGRSDMATEPTYPAPPRVFKTRRRVYGHRVLRINQQKEGDEDR